jgi:hypothetical protein
VRVWLVVILAVSSQACTFNFTRKESERIKQQVELYKWLYEKGLYRSDPEMMRRAAARLLDVKEEREAQPSQAEVLERLLRRLEETIDRLTKNAPSS